MFRLLNLQIPFYFLKKKKYLKLEIGESFMEHRCEKHLKDLDAMAQVTWPVWGKVNMWTPFALNSSLSTKYQ